MLRRFHLIPERNGQTDRHTDGQINMLTRDKKIVNDAVHSNSRLAPTALLYIVGLASLVKCFS